MKKWNTARVGIVLLTFIALYLLVISKLFYWQIVESETLKKIGRDQSSESIAIEAERGEILASDNYPLVANKYSYLVYANPRVIKNKEEYSKKLSEALRIDKATISAELAKDKYWIRIAASINEKEKEQIESLKLKGLGFQQQNLRYYPEASMSAQVIGFLGKDKEGNPRGYFGLEGYYNRQLEGRRGSMYVIKDALGNTILNDIREERKIDGRKLVVNIDRTVQYIADKRLKEGIERYAAEGGTVVIMEPQTGKILAMSSFPRFDPQKYWEFETGSYKNPAISSLYEPGSTFKVLIMSAALDLGLIKPDTRCNTCEGPVSIGGYKIKTWNDTYYPNTSMIDVLKNSDNTGMVFIGNKLGKDNLLLYLKKFGVDKLTDVDLQGEVGGSFRKTDSWYPIDLATATFGQGISVTPLGLVTAVNAIANGGNLMKPYIVSQVITEDGREIPIKPQVKRRIFKESTTKVMTWMMVNTVEKGEAQWVKLKNYKVAGKTGTAQIPVAGHYDPTQTNASFVGFFPAENPKITMLVVVNKPKTAIYGAETAAPIFFNIAKDVINYYNIPPVNE